jgi:hypothetical protein
MKLSKIRSFLKFLLNSLIGKFDFVVVKKWNSTFIISENKSCYSQVTSWLIDYGTPNATFELSQFMSWYVGQDYHLGCVLRAKRVICIKLKIDQTRWWLPDVDSG